MATIGELAVNVVANLGGLVSGLNTARKSVGSFAAKISALPAVGKSVGVLADGFRAVAGAVREALPEIDEIGKTAARLGIGTEELIALRHAADLSGAGAENADKGLQQLTIRLSQAAAQARTAQQGLGQMHAGFAIASNGGSETSRVLQQLGLDAQRLSEMGPAKAFGEIADAIKKIPDRAGQVRAAFALFGEQGVKLLNTLDGGKAGLEDMRREAERLGIAFSAADAARVEAANDSVDRLYKSFRGLRYHLAIEVAPSIQRIADDLQAIVDKVGPGLRALFRDLGTILEQNARNARWLVKTLGGSGGGLGQLILGGPLGQLLGRLNFGSLTPEFADFPTQAQGNAARERERARGDENLLRQAQEAERRRQASQQERVAAAARRAASIQEDARRVWESTLTPMQRLTQEFQRLKFLFDQGAISAGTFHAATVNARRGFDEEARRARESDPRFQRERSLRERAQEIFESTRTPLETFRREVGELFELMRRGLLDPETFRRRRAEIFGAAREGLPEAQPTQFAGAALRGTQEAFSAILRAASEGDLLSETKRQTKFLEGIERAALEAARTRPVPLAL